MDEAQITYGASDATYTVSVRNLCAFAAKSGDVDLRFRPTPTAKEGREGHQLVAQRRGAGYQAEVALHGSCEELCVRGRADGYDPALNLLEEIKTFRGRVEAIAPNHSALHWAQLKVYGWLLCRERELQRIQLALVYFDVVEQTEHPLQEAFEAAELGEFFYALCTEFLAWARTEIAHRNARDSALRRSEFPQRPFRPGQHHLASEVYRATTQSKTLLVQAPTGIGKTIGVLYPALRAMPERGIDKLFFLTAKTPGRQVALEALQKVSSTQHPCALRVVELVAKDKCCEYPELVCHGDSCPLASGFYDRLPAARLAAAQAQWLDQASLRKLALAHSVCPYFLGHEMVRWADVVVGDYNYYFDRSAMLFALTQEGNWRVSVLVDEAHNLYSRSCSMYSETLSYDDALALAGEIPKTLRPRFHHFLGQWRLLLDKASTDESTVGWALLKEVPALWLAALQHFNTAAGEYLNERPSEAHGAFLGLYFATVGFAELANAFGDHSLCELSRTDTTLLAPAGRSGVDHRQRTPAAGDAARQLALEALEAAQDHVSGSLTLRNVVPAHFIAKRLATADSLVLFSATLHPPDYYINLLGLPETTRLVDIPCPFDPEQLRVLVQPISTRRENRQATLDTLVQTIADQYLAQPGNYLAFFGSFDYMDAAFERLQERYPHIKVWTQERAMTENSRQAYLERFDVGGCGIGFAVLGGFFGEGVDLPGRRLIGAFVVTIGLPQFDQVNQEICKRMQVRFGKGYDYTYLFPGLQKVIQAAGRVIRTQTDTGTVMLLDDRYRALAHRKLLPAWWRVDS